MRKQISVVATALAVLLTAGLAGARTPVAGSGNALLSSPFFGGCSVVCIEQCSGLQSHNTQSPPQPQHIGPPHSSCLGIFCGQGGNHTPCEGFAGLDDSIKTRLWLDAVSGDPARVAAALNRFPNVVEFNKQRRSLQIMDCEGKNVIANIPLNSDIANALAE